MMSSFPHLRTVGGLDGKATTVGQDGELPRSGFVQLQLITSSHFRQLCAVYINQRVVRAVEDYISAGLFW